VFSELCRWVTEFTKTGPDAQFPAS